MPPDPILFGSIACRLGVMPLEACAAGILSALFTSSRAFAPSASSRLARSCDRLVIGILSERGNFFAPLAQVCHWLRQCRTALKQEHWQSQWHPSVTNLVPAFIGRPKPLSLPQFV